MLTHLANTEKNKLLNQFLRVNFQKDSDVAFGWTAFAAGEITRQVQLHIKRSALLHIELSIKRLAG